MADYTTQAQQAALDALDADFQQVFDRWVEFAPWKHAEKGGAGSGNFGHAGRQGERGGSASSADYTALTDLDITATAAMRYAQEALDSGRRHGILAGNVPQHYQELGFSEGTVKTLRDLGNLYGYGGDNQKRAVQQMITALYDGSDLGDALRAQIATETQLVQMYRDHVPAFWEKERERAADDWDWAKTQQANQDEVYIRGGTYPQDGKEQFLASERRTFLQSVSQLYRKGGLDNPIQSWTTDSAGAWMGNAGHIGWDHSLTWDDVERDYYVLAGLGINYGAPGEHEITLIRKDAVPPRESVKGGAGSGNFDHEGRQGLRGGSADDGTPNSPGVSGGSVTHTQAMQLAQQRLGAGLPGNFLSNQAGKHFMQLGFKGPVIKQLYDLSQMYKAGGKQQELAVNHIMTALSDGSELGRALRAQIDTETALAKAKINPARAKLPASKPATGKQGMSAQDKQKRDEAAHNAKQKAEELAGQKRDAQQAEADARAERRGQVGKTEFLGSSPIATVIDQGDTVVSNGQPIAWTEVLSTHHVLAGLGVAYGKRGQIALIRQDAIPPLQPPAKGGSGSGFF